jgi:hypothetical protein
MNQRYVILSHWEGSYINHKVKVQFTLEQAKKVQRGNRDKPYSFFNLGMRWGEWSTPRPGRFTPVKDTRYPLYRQLGGLYGQNERVRENPPPSGFDARTVQPVACRYTDCAMTDHHKPQVNK